MRDEMLPTSTIMVMKVKEHTGPIDRGDADSFQICLLRSFDVNLENFPLIVYTMLR